MSETFYIGLSREQIERLLNGHVVGKRPYHDRGGYPITNPIRYDGTKRIYIKMLTEGERANEPDSAFEW